MRQTKGLTILLAALLGLNACQSSTVPPATQAAPTTETMQHQIEFEIVWNTVKARFYDPSFGGQDWDALGEQYRPRIAAAPDDETFYKLTNQMLDQLHTSHLALVPPGGWERIDPIVFAPGSIGLDLRLIAGQAVVTSVQPDSPAAQAGLRPGYVITAIEDVPIDEIVAQAQAEDSRSDNERKLTNLSTNAVLSRIYGSPGTSVSIAYHDSQDVQHQEIILRIERQRTATLGNDLPPVYLEFETDRLENDVAYVRFNTFHPALLADIITAIDEVGGQSGVIMDLRGNSGGDTDAVEVLARYFLDEAVTFCKLRRGDQTSDWDVTPQVGAYTGPVIVLIDSLTASAGEVFAGCMQGVGRVTIIGERSPGSALYADTLALDDGSVLLYPMAEIRSVEDVVLEGNGVTPDDEVELSRETLLQGNDPQLQAALEYLSR
jgi:carboxyl-terminal processing protease